MVWNVIGIEESLVPKLSLTRQCIDGLFTCSGPNNTTGRFGWLDRVTARSLSSRHAVRRQQGRRVVHPSRRYVTYPAIPLYTLLS